jgi:hypothetical protein
LARAHEQDGDRLRALGPLFTRDALAQYREAQRLSPNARVQQKIDSIESTTAAMEAVGRAIDRADQATNELFDDLGIRQFTGLYAGLRNGIGPSRDLRDFEVGGFVNRVLAVGGRVSYMRGPSWERQVEAYNQGYRNVINRGTTVEEHEGLGVEIGMGLSAPSWFSVTPHALYNVGALVLGSRTYSGGYEPKEQDYFDQIIGFYGPTVGAVVRVPRLPIQFLVQRHWRTYSREGTMSLTHPDERRDHIRASDPAMTTQQYRSWSIGLIFHSDEF